MNTIKDPKGLAPTPIPVSRRQIRASLAPNKRGFQQRRALYLASQRYKPVIEAACWLCNSLANVTPQWCACR
jgi:hypothetical protein